MSEEGVAADRGRAERGSSDSIRSSVSSSARLRVSAEQRAQSSDVPALDDVFDILKNQRRRWVLRSLADQDAPLMMNELAEFIAARENDTTVESLSSRQRKRVYVGLYQCHLPKMDDVGVIEFDKDRGRIEPGEYLPAVQRYMSLSNRDPARWSLRYLAVSASALLAFGLLVVTGTATVTPVSALLGVFLVTMTLLAIAQITRSLPIW